MDFGKLYHRKEKKRGLNEGMHLVLNKPQWWIKGRGMGPTFLSKLTKTVNLIIKIKEQ